MDRKLCGFVDFFGLLLLPMQGAGRHRLLPLTPFTSSDLDPHPVRSAIGDFPKLNFSMTAATLASVFSQITI